ncbi:TRL-like family protein [bacterium]|nr:TRL-like family protein [bacterium]
MPRRMILTALIALSVTALTGCSLTIGSFGPSGAGPGFVYTEDTVYPAANASSTQYTLTTDDFEIKSMVMAEGTSSSILGLFTTGDNGYETLLAEARDQGCDDVMNVRVDVRYSNILFIYQRVDTVLTGWGVKWK